MGGGIAAKTGLLAKLGIMLLAAKKVVIAGVVAVGAAVKKFFGGGKGKTGTVS